VITCPGAFAVNNCFTPNTSPANTGFATATDACTGATPVTYTDTSSSGTCNLSMLITRTWSSTDVCGNTSTCVQLISVNQTDTDGDGTCDCIDLCPLDPGKIAAGQCGCGTPDTDTDLDGIADCNDNCDAYPNPSQQDCDNNGVGDICDIASGALTDRNLNGIPDTCELGLVVSYCTAGTSTHGCTPSISGVGLPKVSMSSGFTVNVTGVEGQKFGLIFYGITGQSNNPWGPLSNSFLCVKGPFLQRIPPAISSGGTVNTCTGSFSTDLLAYLAANPGATGNPFASGDQVWLQGWYRDPPAPKTTNLSNALQVTFQP